MIAIGQAIPLKTTPTCEVDPNRLNVSPMPLTAAGGREQQPGQAPSGEHRGPTHHQGEEEHVTDRVDEVDRHPDGVASPPRDLNTAWKANAAQTAAAPSPAMAPSSHVAGSSRLISLAEHEHDRRVGQGVEGHIERVGDDWGSRRWRHSSLPR